LAVQRTCDRESGDKTDSHIIQADSAVRRLRSLDLAR